MDRLQLKSDARAAMSQANPHPVLVTVVYLVLLFALQMLVSMISGFSSLFPALSSDPESAELIAMGMSIPLLLISIISSFVQTFLQMGYTGYTLRVINRQESGISDLFAYARYFLKVWALYFVMGLFTILWSLLFLIPGIVAGYRYCLAPYLMAENPDRGIMECINESKAMMNGHKMERFILDLSFIPWYLLVAVTCGIASVYVSPYTEITGAAFFNSIRYNTYGQQGGYYQQPGGFQQDGYYQQ